MLIGEDTEDLTAVLARILTQAGFDVRIAPDGPSTLAAGLATPPDLFVLDVQMPRMNGLEVCRTLRADPATATVPVLMVSARVLVNDVAAARDAGADDYLCKPFDNGDLVARAPALLQSRPPASTPAQAQEATEPMG